MTTTNVQRNYKDGLFLMIFRNKQALLSLYNAVRGSNYTNPDDLEIVTLEDVIFMKMKNDLSFMIANTLSLYEHQTTYCPNMPLRGLIYLVRQYEGLVAKRGDDIYGTALVTLPTPEYVIFYNGSKNLEDRTELYLSDAFEAGRGSGCLECKAVMLNINRGRNAELMQKCRRLWEYSEFVAEVNECLTKGYSLKRAVISAMDNCIDRGILEDVLTQNKAEVMHMLLTEYDEKKHMKNVFSDGEKLGFEKGERSGFEKGAQAMIEKLIYTKWEAGKSIDVIAAELDMKTEEVERIVEQRG